MTCSKCRRSWRECRCPDLDSSIETFLQSPEGRQLDHATHNQMVQRAADVIEGRIRANEKCFLKRFPDVRLFPTRRLWKPKTTKRS